MKRLSRILLIGIFLFVSPVGLAQGPDETIDRLLEVSGVSAQVGHFPDLVKSGLPGAKHEGKPFPEATLAAMAASADETILPGEILSALRESLKTVIDDQEAQALLAWYESDPGKEILRAEEKAAVPGAYDRMIEQAQTLAADKERVAIANRIDILRGATEMSLGLQEDSTLALFEALETVARPDSPVDTAGLEAQITERREENRRAIGQMVILSFIYSYQDVEFGKLEQYESFLEQPASIRFNETVMDSLRTEFKRSVTAWGEAVAALSAKAKG